MGKKTSNSSSHKWLDGAYFPRALSLGLINKEWTMPCHFCHCKNSARKKGTFFQKKKVSPEKKKDCKSPISKSNDKFLLPIFFWDGCQYLFLFFFSLPSVMRLRGRVQMGKVCRYIPMSQQIGQFQVEQQITDAHGYVLRMLQHNREE